jgi:hypothetical protein
VLRPVTRQQKTGYYVTTDDGMYADAQGHVWFSKDIARDLAHRLGGWYDQGNRTTIKVVVTGYDRG